MDHLAQLNVARLRYKEGDPRVQDFFDNISRINALADRMPGFVWRLKEDGGDSAPDPMMLINMSVWENVEALEKFVWQTAHRNVYRRKTDWMEKPAGPYLVMWWIPQGHVPSLAEGKERLHRLATEGPSDYAFGWESVLQAKLWRAARCA
jgi:hypothetical protein